MKRKSNLYEDIFDYDNILSVTNDVLKTNRNRRTSLEFKKNLNTNLIDIKKCLENDNYIWQDYAIFMIKDPKYRVIMSEKMSDKIVNHLVSRFILLPSIEKCNIDTNVATRKKKGSDYAFKYFCKYVKKIGLDKKIYVLKIDISKYFYNIDHDVLIGKLRKKIKDPRAMKIVKDILNSTNNKYVNDRISLIVNKEISRIKRLKISDKEKYDKISSLRSVPLYNFGKGLPIGNMTSQILAIFYLNDVDHYIKEVLGVKYYIRYMDDLVLLDTDKEKLNNYFKLITNKIKEHKLSINKKSNIYDLRVGISFLGYTFKIKYDTLWIRYNNDTIRRINRKLRYYKGNNYNLYYKSKSSYFGYLKKSNTSLYYKRLRVRKDYFVYSKYLELKKDFSEALIFIKSGKFYRTYDNDSIIMSYLFDYQLIDNKVGFPLESLFKVKNKLKSSSISYVVLDNNEVSEELVDDNKYGEVLELGMEKYDRSVKTEELIDTIRDRLNKDFSFYEKLKEII